MASLSVSRATDDTSWVQRLPGAFRTTSYAQKAVDGRAILDCVPEQLRHALREVDRRKSRDRESNHPAEHVVAVEYYGIQLLAGERSCKMIRGGHVGCSIEPGRMLIVDRNAQLSPSSHQPTHRWMSCGWTARPCCK